MFHELFTHGLSLAEQAEVETYEPDYRSRTAERIRNTAMYIDQAAQFDAALGDMAGLIEWERRADHRKLEYERSLFRVAVDELFAQKYAVRAGS